VVPDQRSQTIIARLAALPALLHTFNWLQWDGANLAPLNLQGGESETCVQPYCKPTVDAEIARIVGIAPTLLQAVPHIAGRAVSIRFRGLEVARVAENVITYPLGEPLEALIDTLAEERRHGSRHPLARAHEEAWLESNLIGRIRDVLPVRQDAIYPQVPSFKGEERKIIDLLAVTDEGRLVVIEIKASSDPDGYFRDIRIRNEPAVLVMVAPLLSFHKGLDRLLAILPPTLPLLQVGINQTWKREIKVLRRKGALG
jgi:hypothetical protein